jgi:hypothetical protein
MILQRTRAAQAPSRPRTGSPAATPRSAPRSWQPPAHHTTNDSHRPGRAGHVGQGIRPWRAQPGRSRLPARRTVRGAHAADVRYMRSSSLERAWHATILEHGHQARAAATGDPDVARAPVLRHHGLPPPCPPTWQRASVMILADEARYLSEADLYLLTPQMLAVVAAAAQTLSHADLALLRRPTRPCCVVTTCPAPPGCWSWRSRCGCPAQAPQKSRPAPGGYPARPATRRPGLPRHRAASRADVVPHLRAPLQHRLPP